MPKKLRSINRGNDWDIPYINFHGIDPVTYEDQVEIFKLYQKNDLARPIYVSYLVQANMGLVIKLSRIMVFQGRGQSPNDLIAEGVIGLIRALETFDLHRGTTIATYATPWIKQRMQNACSRKSFEQRPVYVPNSADTVRKVVEYARRHLKKILGREPFDEEIAAELRPPNAKHYNAERARLNVIAAKQRAGMQSIPLTGPSKGDSDARSPELQEILADDRIWPQIMILESRETLDRCLGALTLDREREIFQRRCGVDRPQETLEEIGADLCLSKERVRQIEHRIIAQLGTHGISRQDIKQAVTVLFGG